jgi:hypothetical protein
MLEMFLEFLKKRVHPHKKIDSAHTEHRREALQKFNVQLNDLKETMTDKNVKIKAHEFYTLVKTIFKESLALKYEATFQEITEEIEKNKHYNANLRQEIVDFLTDVGMMEYGYEEFRELVDSKKHEKEKMLKEYIDELEREGSHVKKETKRKIANVVSESIPHTDREFMLRMIERFKAMMHQML